MHAHKVTSILILGLFFLWLPLAQAQYGKSKVTYTTFNWRLYETTHFDIYYYKGAERILPGIAELVEQAYTHHSSRLNFELTSRVPFIMYRNKREFQQTNIILNEISEGVGGFSEIVHNRMVLPVDGSREEVRRLIYHELTHIFQYEIIFHNVLGQALNTVPDWFIEGMAAHMEGAWDSFGLMVLRDAALNGQLPRLQELHNFAYISSPFLGYRAGQSALDYIVETYGDKGLQKLLWEMSKSKTKEMKSMIKKAFNISYREFSEQWRNHVLRQFWKVGGERKSPSSIGKIFPLQGTDRDYSINYFQTSLSPSGDVLAVLDTHRQELDVSLMNAQNGRRVKLLTKNYQGLRYDFILGVGRKDGRNIAWAPDGRSIAFVAKSDGRNTLFIMNPLSGGIIRKAKIELSEITSPAFTADSKAVVIAAYDQFGQSDIFLYQLWDGAVVRLTNDVYIDEFPTISPDGSMLVYASERERNFQLMLIDHFPNGVTRQLTADEFNHMYPKWGSDGQTIVCIGDKDNINDIYTIDLGSEKERRITTTYGGFLNPQFNADMDRIYFDAYFEVGFHTGYMEYDAGSFVSQWDIHITEIPTKEEPEAKEKPKPVNSDPLDLLGYLDGGSSEEQPIEGKKVRFKLLPDAGYAEAGYRTDGLYVADAAIYFSDILGDHRFLLGLRSVQNQSSIALTYFNLKHRYDWGATVFNYRDVTYYVDPVFNDLAQFRQSQTGAAAFVNYPLSRYHRFEFSMARYEYKIEGFPVYDPSTGSYVILPDYIKQYNPLTVSFVRDTVRYRSFGPYQGSTFQIGVEKGIAYSKSYADFLNYFWDLRAYKRVSRRSLFATRLLGTMSTGPDSNVYSIGGGTTLRGYDYNELAGNNIYLLNVEYRFPLIDYLRISFLGTFTNIRGALYWDSGLAWFEGQEVTPWESSGGFHFVDVKSSLGFGLYWFLGYFELRFDWARKTDLQGMTSDLVYQFSIGRSF